MQKQFFLIIIFSFQILGATLFAQADDSVMIRKIYKEALVNPVAYHNLDYLCNKIGGRLCGSAQAEKAVQWTKRVLDGMGLDTVYLQPVMVSHWERGEKEKGKVISGKAGNHLLNVCAIGGSVATPGKGVTAEVVEVKNFEQLRPTVCHPGLKMMPG
jgi:hypothetical protein